MAAAVSEAAPCESGGLLHNMSAPPRSTARVRPLRSDGRNARVPRGWGGQQASFFDGPSGRFFARVHLVGLLSGGNSHVCVGADIARGVTGLPHDLIDAVAMLRTGRKTGKALAAAAEACARVPVADLIDEFVARVAALDDSGLPALLLARPLDPAASVSRRIDHLTALRLLAGTAGGVFVRSRAPSAANLLSGLPGAEPCFTVAYDFHLAVSHG